MDTCCFHVSMFVVALIGMIGIIILVVVAFMVLSELKDILRKIEEL